MQKRAMFSRLGRVVVKHARWVILGWIILTVTLILVAPRLSEVSVAEESLFLPRDTESTLARELVQEKFPTLTAAGTGVLVLYRESGLGDGDLAYAQSVEDWLTSSQVIPEVEDVISIFDNPQLESVLVSSDQTTMLLQVEFSVPPYDNATGEAVTAIRENMPAPPPGLGVYLSGETGIATDLLGSIRRSIDNTTLVTIGLVMVLLLLIYRSPVASMVPLITIGVSFLVARALLGFLAQAGLQLFTLVDAYLIVIIFGVGTDYCLFIMSRFREELRDNENREAGIKTVGRIGAVITASAGTVVVGFMGLATSRFGMTQTMGPALGLGIVVTLVAGLTLAPALMTLFGRWLFWPTKVAGEKRERSISWAKIGRGVANRPLLVAIPVIIALLLPYIGLRHFSRQSDLVSAVSPELGSVRGFQVMKEHFSVGELAPTVVLIESSQGDILTAGSLSAVQQVTKSLEKVEGVGKVRSAVQPTGQPGEMAPFLVKNQLQQLSEPLYSWASLLRLGIRGDLSGLVTRGEAELVGLEAYLVGLRGQYSELATNSDYLEARSALEDLRATLPLLGAPAANLSEVLAALQGALQRLSNRLEVLAIYFTRWEDAYFISGSMIESSPELKNALSSFVSGDGTTARLEVVLETDPYSSESGGTIDDIRRSLEDALNQTPLKDRPHYVGGYTAENTDVLRVTSDDFKRVMLITVLGIFLVLIALLRCLVAPLYMVVTVLLNYGTAIGISTWLFVSVLNNKGVDNMAPLFVFVVLVAVGADYNIFLISRLREEVRAGDFREAVGRAVGHTGGVITAAGVILAGTFGALMTGQLQVVFQVGAAITIGVLIDTFIVRPLLVPSIAAMLGKWSWWPRKLSDR